MSDLDRLVDEAIRAPFSGWDFAWLRGRAHETQPPWNYDDEVAGLLERVHAVLDIDTGGGEVLARQLPVSAMVVATEGYPPNIDVAAAALRPLGAHVVGISSAPDNVDQSGADPATTASHLPFRSESFDVVIDRHSSYWPSEVARVLRPRGTFLTQQRGVGGADLLRLFERAPSPAPAFDLSFAVGQLRDAGFEVLRADEAETPIAFFDIGAFVYFLRAVPWVVPNFDVVEDRDALESVDATIGRDGAFEMRGEHMLLIARRG